MKRDTFCIGIYCILDKMGKFNFDIILCSRVCLNILMIFVWRWHWIHFWKSLYLMNLIHWIFQGPSYLYTRFDPLLLEQCLPNVFSWRHTFESKRFLRHTKKYLFLNSFKNCSKMDIHDLFLEHFCKNWSFLSLLKKSCDTPRSVSRHTVWNTLYTVLEAP